MIASKTQECVSDASLVQRIKNSDHDAFELLFERYQYPLFCYIWRGLNNESDIKDMIQDTFYRLWIHRKSLDSKQSIRAYIYRIARNLKIDFLRKAKHKSQWQDIDIRADALQASGGSISASQFNCALDEMPETVKEAFFMNRLDGLKYAEIAVIQRVSVKTVEARMSRALKIFRKNF